MSPAATRARARCAMPGKPPFPAVAEITHPGTMAGSRLRRLCGAGSRPLTWLKLTTNRGMSRRQWPDSVRCQAVPMSRFGRILTRRAAWLASTAVALTGSQCRPRGGAANRRSKPQHDYLAANTTTTLGLSLNVGQCQCELDPGDGADRHRVFRRVERSQPVVFGQGLQTDQWLAPSTPELRPTPSPTHHFRFAGAGIVNSMAAAPPSRTTDSISGFFNEHGRHTPGFIANNTALVSITGTAPGSNAIFAFSHFNGNANFKRNNQWRHQRGR